MKRTISIILTIFLLLVAFVPVSADDTSQKELLALSERLAQEYIEVVDSSFIITGETPLLDGGNEIKGYLFHTSNKNNINGYVTVFAYDGILRVTESSFETDVLLGIKNDVYYNSIFDYYVKEGESLVNAQTKEIIGLSELRSFNDVSLDGTSTQSFRPVHSNDSYSINTTNSYNGAYMLSSSVTAISQFDASSYPKARCMQTSAAMLIQYYQEHKTGYSSIASHSGGELIDDLCQYIPLTNTSYTTLGSLKSGLGEYISDNGFSSSIFSNSCDLDYDTLPEDFTERMADELTNDRPMIMIIGSDAVYISGDRTIGEESNSMHALLVRGVIFYSFGTYIVCVDPWDAASKQILWDPYNSESRDHFAVYSVVRVSIHR